MTSLLEVRGLSVRTRAGDTQLLRDISLSVEEGEIVGLVGESGSGKSMTALALMGLLPDSMELLAGSASVAGKEYLAAGAGRHPDLAMIFQNARAALNPTMPVGKQIARICRMVAGARRARAREAAVELLTSVGIPGAERVARSYPHQLSGGMCQRVMIAMALAARPKMLIADEPTTGLDVTVQAQILALLAKASRDSGLGTILITHDLAVVGQVCDRVVVMYGGQVMETAPAKVLFDHPRHPYTQKLLASLSADDDSGDHDPGVDFSVPGCRFVRRCELATAACESPPPLVTVESSVASCHLLESVA
ncbi:MAG: peptide/nickel transport system ATP-binding protein [Actinomycetota bacterium]|jgi:oligopeptide/dipeptide ABC transporter ATP-binding protein|nr:peptide/nickel transport system ATP-binding protein [Actinomycetota bacterium]